MLLAFDLDRTVVTDDYQLPDAAVRAIAAARAAGHLVTVLTGRARAAAEPYLGALEVTGPFSVNHGALVLGPGGTPWRRTQLEAGDVRTALFPYLAQEAIEFSCLVDDVMFVRDPADACWHWAHAQNRTLERFDPGFSSAADKVVFAAAATSAAIAERLGRELPHLTRYLWGDGFLELIGPGADKGSALALIAQRLGVPRDEVVAFGDGLNDVSMLEWAAHGVAVGDEAHPAAVAAAQERVAAPEHGGVVGWLEANVL